MSNTGTSPARVSAALELQGAREGLDALIRKSQSRRVWRPTREQADDDAADAVISRGGLVRTCILCRKPFFSRHIGKPHLPPLRQRPPTGVRVMSKSNIISLRTRMEISEYFLQIGGESYRVRRAVESDTNGGGFVVYYDRAGQPVVVFCRGG